MKRWVYLVMTFLVISLAMPGIALADNTTALNAESMRIGSVRLGTFSSTRQYEWFKLSLVAGRSYSVECWFPYVDMGEDSGVSCETDWFLDDGTTSAGGQWSAEKEPRLIVFGMNGETEGIIPTAADCSNGAGCTYILRISSSDTASSQSFLVTVTETTLFSPYWAVATTAGYDAAPQIKNNTKSNISYTATIYYANGNVACTRNSTIGSQDMHTFSIASQCGISSGTGSVEIAFQAPTGALTANTTTWSTTSGISFDAPFTTRTGYDSPVVNDPI